MSQHYSNIIIGAGIAGLSLGAKLDSDSLLLEKNSTVGGLSRSYDFCGTQFDIGPHIIFSKNEEILEKHSSMIPTNKVKRSNQIYLHGRYVKYPFENDLSSLPDEINQRCLHEFLNNPYSDINYTNMQQFFLKNFGQAICDEYLLPYNKKIWKFDPACLDTQMVERIPKPPASDIIKSSKGENTEGYTHQLYFYYPSYGGFQTLINKYVEEFLSKNKKNSLEKNCNIQEIEKTGDIWTVTTTNGLQYTGDRLINTSPIHEFRNLIHIPETISQKIDDLLYNSIHIVMVAVKKDIIGDHFALYLPQQEIIFHRLSKLTFLGDHYVGANGETILMAEVTFRRESALGKLTTEEIISSTIDDLVSLGFIDKADVVDTRIITEKYAYVIYDLNHRSNTDQVLSYLEENEIYSCGRFATFEYLNTDGVVEQAWSLAKKLEY